MDLNSTIEDFKGLGITVEHVAYHVTNVPVTKDQPQWKDLICAVANDKYYDGELLGLPVVFLSTTLYKENLPTVSTYPRNGVKDQYYWRVSVKLNQFSKHSMWLMANVGNQVHILLTDPGSCWTLFLQKFVTHYKNIVALEDNNKYLNRSEGVFYPNNYGPTKFFVNIALLDNLSISEDSKWDKEARNTGAKTGAISELDIVHSRRKLTWLFEKIGIIIFK